LLRAARHGARLARALRRGQSAGTSPRRLVELGALPVDAAAAVLLDELGQAVNGPLEERLGAAVCADRLGAPLLEPFAAAMPTTDLLAVGHAVEHRRRGEVVERGLPREDGRQVAHRDTRR